MPVQHIQRLVVLHDVGGWPLEADMIRFNDTLPPAQLRGVHGSTDKSLKRLTTRRKDNHHYPTYFPTPDRVSSAEF